MSKFTDFNQSVMSALNNMYTANSHTTVSIYSQDIGIRVEITNVASQEIAEIQRLLDEHPHWADWMDKGPVGNKKLEEATEEIFPEAFVQPIYVMGPHETVPMAELAKLDHVHTHDGKCFKNRYGVCSL